VPVGRASVVGSRDPAGDLGRFGNGAAVRSIAVSVALTFPKI
jgi:hypothetical protein